MDAAVVVVGAGPAGATAAMRLHRAGVPVVLLDRARFPRDKICGDLLPPRTFPLLEQAGFQPSWDPVLRRSALLARGSVVFERLAQQRPQAWRSSPAGVLSLTPIAEALPRRVFDALLVAQLRQQGLVLRGVGSSPSSAPIRLAGAGVCWVAVRSQRLAPAAGSFRLAGCWPPMGPARGFGSSCLAPIAASTSELACGC